MSSAGPGPQPQRPRDDDVLDFTDDPVDIQEYESDQHKIHLASGININNLMGGQEGVLFEPEIDESLFTPRQEEHSYFAVGGADGKGVKTDADFAQMLRHLRLGDDDDSDDEDADGLSGFDRLAKKMTPLTECGGVKKRIRTPGLETAGPVPSHGTVTIHYSLYLETQDEPFDSSSLRGRAERHKLDDGRLLPGLEMAVKSMLKEEQSEFLIQPEFAFGRFGCPPRVPADAQVLARVELLHFVQEEEAEALLAMRPEDRDKAKTFDDIEKVVRREHIEGNDYVKKEEYKLAAKRYDRGIRLLEDASLKDDEEEKRQKHLLLKLYLNRSHCLIKVQWPRKACLTLQKALMLDERNAKALYRMAKAKRMLANNADARRYLLRAQRVAPNDTTIGLELASLDRQVRTERENERKLCSKMFGARGGAGGGDQDTSAASAPPPPMPGQIDDVDDEFYEDLVEQITGFTDDPEEESMLLPSSLSPSQINLAKMLSDERDLEMEEIRRGSIRQWKIIKKK